MANLFSLILYFITYNVRQPDFYTFSCVYQNYLNLHENSLYSKKFPSIEEIYIFLFCLCLLGSKRLPVFPLVEVAGRKYPKMPVASGVTVVFSFTVGPC